MSSYNKKLTILTKFLFCSLFLILLTSCKNDDLIILCEYKNITVSPEVYEVSAEDLSFATEMNLLEKEVLEKKKSNPDIAEEGDVLDLTLTTENGEKCRIKMVHGESLISENFDYAVLGLKTNQNYTIPSENNICSVYIHDIYQYSKKITDDIAQKYYKKTTADEVVSDIKTDIEEHRKFEYAYEQLITKSKIKSVYAEKSDYVNRILNNLRSEANKSNLSFEEILNDYYGSSPDEYRNYLNSFYDEYSVLKAFSHAENIVISEQECLDSLKTLSENYEISENECLSFYGKEYIEYLIYYDKAYPVLLKYVN